MGDKVTIGWREWVRLPELGIERIKTKVDTGARTSTLHAEDIRMERRDERTFVRFTVHPKQRQKAPAVEAEAELVAEREIRSSSGHSETRPVILTTVDVGGHLWPIEVTLTERDAMGFRMLLGRQALRGRAVVDPGRSYVTRKKKR